MMKPLALLGPLILLSTACGEDIAGVPESTGACTITERVRLVAPAAGWMVQQYGEYDFHVLDDFILYTFDEREDPERLVHRLDRCTGESAPFPSFAPGMSNPFVLDTPAGQVMYAKKGDDYYVVDRLDVPGDDAPRKLAGLPRPGFLDLNVWGLEGRPYAFFWRDHAIYTHAGDPAAPALRVAEDVDGSVPYVDAILVVEQTGDVRIVDPFTGTSEIVLGGAQRSHLVNPGDAINDARVLWQPIGVPELRIRRIGDGQDVLLAIDPALVNESEVGWWPGDDLTLFSDREYTQILAAVDNATGATLTVPAHLDFDADLLPAVSLTLADPDQHVAAIWNPRTGALREWYRGPGPVPSLQAADDTHADYFVREQDDPLVGSLWRADFVTGETRELVARMSPWSTPVAEHTELVAFELGSQAGIGPLYGRNDLEYVDIEAGRSTPIATAVADSEAVPGEGVIWLDVHGAMPGLWVAPLP